MAGTPVEARRPALAARTGDAPAGEVDAPRLELEPRAERGRERPSDWRPEAGPEQ